MTIRENLDEYLTAFYGDKDVDEMTQDIIDIIKPVYNLETDEGKAQACFEFTHAMRNQKQMSDEFFNVLYSEVIYKINEVCSE